MKQNISEILQRQLLLMGYRLDSTLSENIKNFVNSIIPNWINNKNNELSLASEFKSMQLLDEEESPIEDRILFGKEAEKLIKEGLKG